MKNKISKRFLHGILAFSLILPMVSIPSAGIYAESLTKQNQIIVTDESLEKPNEIRSEIILPESTMSPMAATLSNNEISPFAENQNENTYLIKDVNFRKVVNRHLGKSVSLLETYSATELNYKPLLY